MATAQERLKPGTIFEDFADAGPLVLAASVSLHVWKHSALVGPEVVPGTKEEDGELSDLVPQVLDVGGDVPGMVDLCRPPPEEDAAQSDPAGPDTPPQDRRRSRSAHLYFPNFTQMMSVYLGFLPALQSLQNQLPSGMAMLRQSG